MTYLSANSSPTGSCSQLALEQCPSGLLRGVQRMGQRLIHQAAEGGIAILLLALPFAGEAAAANLIQRPDEGLLEGVGQHPRAPAGGAVLAPLRMEKHMLEAGGEG